MYHCCFHAASVSRVQHARKWTGRPKAPHFVAAVGGTLRLSAFLPATGTFFVTVSEPLEKTGRFGGAYAVSLESTLNAWATFVAK
jgi:hypothetical protein